MNFLRNRASLHCFFLLVPLLGLNAQDYKFRQFGIEEGICHPFVYTVNQDKSGYLWLGTGEGLCRYDGFGFEGDVTADSLPAAFAKKSYKDNNGDLWFGHNDGSITCYDGRSFSIIELEDRITSTINDIAADGLGNIVFLTQNRGMIVVDPDRQARVIDSPFRGMLLSSLEFTGQGNLLIGGYDGLHLFESQISNDTLFPLFKIEEVPYTRVTDIHRDGDTYWIGTDGEGMYRMVFSDEAGTVYEAGKVATGTQLDYASVLSIFEDSEGVLWLSTQGDGVYKMDLSDDGRQVEELVNFNGRELLDKHLR
jgi:ligand-binding sensor domain-containing protein